MASEYFSLTLYGPDEIYRVIVITLLRKKTFIKYGINGALYLMKNEDKQNSMIAGQLLTDLY